MPDLYLTQFPLANASAIGTDKPIVVLNSELVRILDEEAAASCSRTRPRTCTPTTCSTGRRCSSCCSSAPPCGCRCWPACPLLAIQLALLEWSRAAELSCDRAAALVTRDPRRCAARS